MCETLQLFVTQNVNVANSIKGVEYNWHVHAGFQYEETKKLMENFKQWPCAWFMLAIVLHK